METKQATAKLRHLRLAPRKVRLLVDLVRGLSVVKAIQQLENSGKQASRPLVKLLQSAAANAQHNHKIKEETLVIKKITVDDGAILYRWLPKAMGRATPIRHRSCHIDLVLEGEVETKEVKKKEIKEKETKETKATTGEKKKTTKVKEEKTK